MLAALTAFLAPYRDGDGVGDSKPKVALAE
jgi:hypothetical protein